MPTFAFSEQTLSRNWYNKAKWQESWLGAGTLLSRVAGCGGGWQETAGSKELSKSAEHLSKRKCIWAQTCLKEQATPGAVALENWKGKTDRITEQKSGEESRAMQAQGSTTHQLEFCEKRREPLWFGQEMVLPLGTSRHTAAVFFHPGQSALNPDLPPPGCTALQLRLCPRRRQPWGRGIGDPCAAEWLSDHTSNRRCSAATCMWDWQSWITLR